MERKKLVEPSIFSDGDGDEETFLADYNHCDILDHDVNAMIESFINLLEISDPAIIH